MTQRTVNANVDQDEEDIEKGGLYGGPEAKNAGLFFYFPPERINKLKKITFKDSLVIGSHSSLKKKKKGILKTFVVTDLWLCWNQPLTICGK